MYIGYYVVTFCVNSKPFNKPRAVSAKYTQKYAANVYSAQVIICLPLVDIFTKNMWALVKYS